MKKDQPEKEKEKKIKPGGARKGAGRKAKYIDPVSLTFSLERTTKEKLRKTFGSTINELFNKWVISLLDEKKTENSFE